MASGRVLVYGGRGALGAKCVTQLKAANFWVASVDLGENPEADVSVAVKTSETFVQQESDIVNAVSNALNNQKLDGIFCVAGNILNFCINLGYPEKKTAIYKVVGLGETLPRTWPKIRNLCGLKVCAAALLPPLWPRNSSKKAVFCS